MKAIGGVERNKANYVLEDETQCKVYSLCLYIQVSWQSMEGPSLSPRPSNVSSKIGSSLSQRKERLVNMASIWLTQFTPQVAVYGLYITASN